MALTSLRQDPQIEFPARVSRSVAYEALDAIEAARETVDTLREAGLAAALTHILADDLEHLNQDFTRVAQEATESWDAAIPARGIDVLRRLARLNDDLSASSEWPSVINALGALLNVFPS